MRHLINYKLFESLDSLENTVKEILYPFKDDDIEAKIVDDIKTKVDIMQVQLFHKDFRTDTHNGGLKRKFCFKMDDERYSAIEHLISYMSSEGWIFSHDYYHINKDTSNSPILSKNYNVYNESEILKCDYDTLIFGIALYFRSSFPG